MRLNFWTGTKYFVEYSVEGQGICCSDKNSVPHFFGNSSKHPPSFYYLAKQSAFTFLIQQLFRGKTIMVFRKNRGHQNLFSRFSDLNFRL